MLHWDITRFCVSYFALCTLLNHCTAWCCHVLLVIPLGIGVMLHLERRGEILRCAFDAQSEFGPETPKQDKSQPGPSISRALLDGLVI